MREMLSFAHESLSFACERSYFKHEILYFTHERSCFECEMLSFADERSSFVHEMLSFTHERSSFRRESLSLVGERFHFERERLSLGGGIKHSVRERSLRGGEMLYRRAVWFPSRCESLLPDGLPASDEPVSMSTGVEKPDACCDLFVGLAATMLRRWREGAGLSVRCFGGA